MLRVVFSKNNLTRFQSDLSRILNLMNPVSVKIGTHLDTYTAKVTLEYEGHTDCETLQMLQEAASLREAFCATCEVFAYDLDEDGNPDNCYMFKKPTSYEYTAYPDRINVEIEFGEVNGGPNVDKKCKEIEILRDCMKTMSKLMKEEFDKNSKKNEDDNAKHSSEYSGMCATCPSKGHCMAGNCILLQIERIQEESNNSHISDNNKKEEDDNMKLKVFFEGDDKTYTDIRFRDWLNSSDSVLFTTDEVHKQYTLELRTPANFDLNTVSMPCLNSLVAYMYEVSDKHPEPPAYCYKLSSIKNFDYKHESYSYYRIILNFDKKEEGSDIDAHCGLKHFIDCISGQTTYTLDVDRSDDIKRSDIIKHLTDNAAVIKTCAPNGQFLNMEFIRNRNNDNSSDDNKNEIKETSKNESSDNMKHFSSCVGMCPSCASNGHCLAGIGDDNYAVADKAELIRRLKNDKLGEISIEEIKKVLKKEYGYDYDKECCKATTRISKPEYYLKIAEAVSLRGTCLRRKFGSIIVKDDRIVSTGYVGAPRGRINCCDRGTCFRIEHNIPSGEAYHKCRSTHSEMNAVIQASPEEMKDATLYLVGIENDGSYTNADCCTLCKRIIINSGISTVVARQADGGFKTILVSDWVKNDDTLDIDHKGY